ncbi:putative membrane protein/domain protein [uncultured Mycobacterium sp.]|uniref:Putative membrane protein/domain protein n=1 Tax=uncultured Mycobacterium sp. TaxID=171292 RepID=A0A1Y5PQJ6_9MYCO|nr:putative membrane protein/domain protein [uncultured Mycobacterium sp.]
MTIADLEAEETVAEPSAPELPGELAQPDHVWAPWRSRAGAIALDVVPGTALLAVAVLAALTVPLRGPWWWVFVTGGALAMVGTGVNRWVLPVTVGNSIGRAVYGLRVASRDGDNVGPWCLLLRDCAHVLDTVVVIGWLWPIWNARRGTFADMIARTRVEKQAVGGGNRPRRYAIAVALCTASLCLGVAVASYVVVGRDDYAVQTARAQVTAEGPHAVEQLLSYKPDTIEADFDRARKLATDSYRAQLSAQQQAVRKANLVRNQYWVINSSVVDATPQKVTLLLFLEGERGDIPNQRYLTASVRARFVKNSDGWQVDRLDVVTAPQSKPSRP